MNIITSKANNVVKNTKKLLQKKYRKDSYLIEGWHLFEEAVNAQAKIRHIFVLEEFVDRVQDFPQVYVVTAEILADLADSKTPQGIVAELAFEEATIPSVLKGKYLFLEDVQDPGNVGTIIRTADAAGYDGVFISQHSADIYNLKTLRSMQGSHFHLPIYQMKTSDFLELAKQIQLPVLATTLSRDSIDYRELAPMTDFVLVLGNEGQGISQQMMDKADQLVHISMKGRAESLNVAVAAGILIFSLS